ncbi:hypothetical protein FQN57_001671 [Myotisia sp. PD_48]|nr:hypothetical protein FQN57_001671 [Myotisia sp. PD_48]
MASKLIIALIFPTLLGIVGVVLGSIAWRKVNSLQLPMSSSITGLGTFLPFITLAVAAARRAPRRTMLQRSSQNTPRVWLRRATVALNEIIVPLQAFIAIIALTYLPSGQLLSCRLGGQWQTYFQTKNSRAIRAIQDALQCCGFRSTRDRAWPFKDATHDDGACVARFGYQRSCMDSWEASQKQVASMIFAVAMISWAISMILKYSPRDQQTWVDDHGAAAIPQLTGSQPRLLPFRDEEDAGADANVDVVEAEDQAGTGRRDNENLWRQGV